MLKLKPSKQIPMTQTTLELWELLSQIPPEPEQTVVANADLGVKTNLSRPHKPINPYWPELPRGRADIDHVNNLLADWIELASSSPPPVANSYFKNSVIHVIECALLLWLAPYASKRCFDSEIFIDIYEFAQHCNNDVFQNGYPLEMAEALNTCFSLESPWELSQESAKKYADQLIGQLKDLALYHAEVSEFWSEKFGSGRKKGTKSDHSKYVEGVVLSRISDDNKSLWKELKKHIEDDEGDHCPLWVNGEKICKSGGDNEFTFKAFEKQLVKLRESTKKQK
jgi:hypothetical protein